MNAKELFQQGLPTKNCPHHHSNKALEQGVMATLNFNVMMSEQFVMNDWRLNKWECIIMHSD